MKEELDKILCTQEIEGLKTRFIINGWVTVSDKGIYCALADDKNTDEALKGTSWDLLPGDAFPSVWDNHNGEYYKPYGRSDNKDFEPLIFWRNPPIGKVEHYSEVLQEFILYHRLYEKQQKRATVQQRIYVHIDDNGDEEDYVLIDGYNVKIKIKALREYLWVRKINILIFIDQINYSLKTYSELGIDGTTYNHTISGDDLIYFYSQLPQEFMQFRSDSMKSGVRIMGKCVIRYTKPKAIIEDQYENFIIGTDDEGCEITFSCDEEKLSNGYKKNIGAPDTLTPVYFSKDVLDKYYNDTDKYNVEDGYLRCGGLWGLHIDNNNSDYIVIMLYELGRIPYKEQKYWRQFNIGRPEKAGLSATSFTRWICGNFCDPVNPDLKFKYEYSKINKHWHEKFGWPLFLPLTPEDAHRAESLHSLTKENNEQEFDEQILSLVKITIDSLNQKELLINTDVDNERVISYLKDKKYDSLKNVTKGIERLEIFLISNGVEDPKSIGFLKNLYALRSFDIAHRKSSDPKKRGNIIEYFDYDNKSKREIVDMIFDEFLIFFNALRELL